MVSKTNMAVSTIKLGKKYETIKNEHGIRDHKFVELYGKHFMRIVH